MNYLLAQVDAKHWNLRIHLENETIVLPINYALNIEITWFAKFLARFFSMKGNFGFVKIILSSDLKFEKLEPISAFKDIFHDPQVFIFDFQRRLGTFILVIRRVGLAS